ncbi:MAG: DNA repair protein RecN [Acidobacteriota bacterium]|nr:DNA repair protein RecN [Acidobacteriota bacterium]MDH3785908.1 DNA repair protein RecN [Acidobacteriota bacterium]
MLKTLRIRDLVLVESLEIEFVEGLNLLTGETGAGKSILLDALGLLVGSRGDRQRIRAGKDRAVIEAVLEMTLGSVPQNWADENGVDSGDDGCWILRRELAADGRSRAFVNGSPTPLRTLAEFGTFWLELHGQHDQQQLLRPDRQLRLLDAFGGHDLQLETTALRHDEVLEQRKILERWRVSVADRERRLAELTETIGAIEEVAPRIGEREELDQRRNRLRHGAALREGLDRIADWLQDGDASAVTLSAWVAREARSLAELDPSLTVGADRIESAMLELEDLGRLFEDARRATGDAADNLEEVETRRAALERLCLKHGEDEAAVLETLEQAKSEQAALGDPEAEIARAEKRVARAETGYVKAAAALSAARQTAAHRLAPAWRKQLAPLAMKDASLKIELPATRGESVGEGSKAVALSRLGAERVELLLSANPGVAPRPLQKVASGGELSRVMLALAIVGGAGAASTQVFDEVDQGVGGAVADAVGSRLSLLSEKRQLLCVTHLPQVAAYARCHIVVHKRVRDGQTRMQVTTLDEETRVDEIARMLSGKRATDTSRSHARQMIGATSRRAGSPS